MRRATAVLLGAALVVGCAGGGGGIRAEATDPFSGDAGERGELRIEVQNYNFSDARIYAVVRDADRRFLGRVTGKRDATFTLRWTLPQPFRLEIDLLAGPRCLTRQIMADPGDVLDLRIEEHFLDTRGCDRSG